MTRRAAIAVMLGLAMSWPTQAQEALKVPLPASHPMIGTWRADLPKLKCFEEYEIRADGTRSSRSAEERNESEFAISVLPGAKGFYKWTDRITKSNGKPDCGGDVTPAGNVAVYYVRLHPSGERFVLCEAEDLKACVVEFRRAGR